MSWSESNTVREIVVENPDAVRVFESAGIDYCCGGRRTLREACEQANVPVANILASLAKLDEAPPESARKWNDAPLSDLTRHIVEKHHGYVRQEVDRLLPLLQKVVSKHGTKHSELPAIETFFSVIAQEMSTHMRKEEQVLFPYIQQMDEAVRARRPIPPAFFGSIENPIANMMADHDDAGELTRQIRVLSNNYTAPAGACPSYIALYKGLEEFEHDLHQHVHLENNLLFPQALEMEKSCRPVESVR